MNGEETVRNWLLTKTDEKITYLTLETELYDYSLSCGKTYRINSLLRYFRWNVEKKLLKQKGYELEEVKGEKWKTWRVVTRSISGLHF